jgi:hypothetical protein
MYERRYDMLYRSKKESIMMIEECFRNIQQEKSIDKNLRLIESAIKREFDINIKVSIVDNKQKFFGMCVYPSHEEINMLTKLLLETNVSMKEVEKVHIEFMTKGEHIVEIDSILLYDHNLNATAGEVTAILLHEIGHIIASNGIVCRFERAKEYMTVRFDTKTRKLVPIIPLITKLFNIATLQMFSNHFNVDLMKEKKADDLAFKAGYGQELHDILGKLIANGQGERVRRSSKDMDKDIELTIDWLIVNIKELEYRKDRLKRSLNILKMTTPSKYLADWIEKINGGIFREEKKALADKVEAINEAFILSKLNDKKFKAPHGALDSSGRVRRLSPRDLDIYRAELERVNTVDDKIFLLERLYDLLEVAEYAKYLLENDPKRVMQSEQTIDMYIEHIHEIIAEVNKRKVTRTKYGLYIKYPADYEG